MELDEPVASTNENSSIQEKLAAISSEEVLDLDYEEEPADQEESDTGEILDSPAQSPTKSSSKEKEDGEQSTDKEDGELEEGEISDSDEEQDPPVQAVSRSGRVADRVPISSRLSRPIVPKQNFTRREGGIRRGKNSKNSRGGEKDESAWERGLRTAKEALRRASKVREEPDFDRKRLIAAPSSDRISQRDSDSDVSNHRRNNSRSSSPRSSRRIPSLLDLHMSPPPKFGSSNRMPPKDLGPQVIYPNRRPKRSNTPDRSRRTPKKNSSRRASPRRSPAKRKRQISDSRDSPLSKKQGFSPVRDASPISSDSDTWTRVESSDNKKKSHKNTNGSSEISDPWARKRSSKEKNRSRRSYSRSCSSQSSRSVKSERSLSRSSSPPRENNRNSKRSPPRGDISYFRIPKKSRQSAGGEPSSKTTRHEEKERSYGRQTLNVSSNIQKHRNRKSTQENKKYSPTKLVEKISDSDSDSRLSSKRRSSSRSGSSSSRSSLSRSRSTSPALPAKYRVPATPPERSASPISDDDDDDDNGSKESSTSPIRRDSHSSLSKKIEASLSPISAGSHRSQSPPSESVKDNESSKVSKEQRRKELQEQLKLVEAELERKRKEAQAI